MNRGQFDRKIVVQRASVSTDDYGGEVPTWVDLQPAWARVRFGTAQEKRQAAQEAGVQAVTFEVVPTLVLLTVTLKDRILFDDSEWDITEVAPLERYELRFSATRSA